MHEPVDVSRLVTEVVAEVQASANERGLHVTVTNLATLPRLAGIDEATLRRPLLQGLDLALGTVSYGTIEIHPELYEPEAERWRFSINGGYSDDGVPDVIISFVIALPAVESVSSGRPLHILAVDDSAQQRALVTAYFDGTAHRVTEAAGGEAAVALARETAFDVVLMDVQMPGTDGLTATRAIREIEASTGRPPALILALTALGASDDVSDAEEAGADDCLSKPLTRSALFKALTQVAAGGGEVAAGGGEVAAGGGEVAAGGGEVAAGGGEVAAGGGEVAAGGEDLSPAQLLSLARYQITTILGATPAMQVERFRMLGQGLSSAAATAGLSDIAHLAASLEHAAASGSAKETEIAARTLQAWMSLGT